MSEAIDTNDTATANTATANTAKTNTADTSLLAEIIGKNKFDDRVDTQPDIKTGEAFALIGRCIQLLGQAKGLFIAKFLLQLGLVFPVLLLPWMAKIVVDNAILQKPLDVSEVVFPPFMDPILALVAGRDPIDSDPGCKLQGQAFRQHY